jgi:predicted transcriptional regulator
MANKLKSILRTLECIEDSRRYWQGRIQTVPLQSLANVAVRRHINNLEEAEQAVKFGAMEVL